ncbi:SDR family NAD(P)-dependent oxidoreductase [Nostoc sp. FACHB-892]|uniref:type I polyketide synthase n=1 Tax=Nostoc sp. FACHB-892 TaxID=2692843 RepID=UPI001683E345|nr:type I polyketide synthase [Nostoc sp. FACHB-892]MBD2731585.1 SDR family NAD(P)-dependent oxidoreductase [Nostoc sp. FACHB-892]
MSYIAVPYQIHFEDTMAYGSHHYLTNFRFQCIAREHFFFGGLFDKETFQDVVILTQQGYSRNMAPVGLGERVAILLTFDEPTRSTTRLCFRVIREDGTPVCCGYQVLVFTSRITGELIPIPPVLGDYVMQNFGLIERSLDSPFAEKVVAGGKEIKKIFTPEVCELGKLITSQNLAKDPSGVQIVDTYISTLDKVNITKVNPLAQNKIVFTFPGQGAYDYQTLQTLYQNYPAKRSLFTKADELTQRYLSYSFLTLIQAQSNDEHQFLLQQCPDLDQIGILLTNIIIAELLIEQGLHPDILVGHSFGELTALTIGGVFDFETSVKIVCQRIQVLRNFASSIGGMMAIACGAQRLTELFNAIQKTALTVAVINHPQQIVVSGIHTELQQVESELVRQGIACTFLKSRYPFHSDLLTLAVESFRSSLQHFSFQTPKIPVYSPINKVFYSANTDFPQTLAAHFIQVVNFSQAVKVLQQQGVHSFIECGASRVLTKLVQKNLPSEPEAIAQSVMSPDGNIIQGLQHILQTYSGQLSDPQPTPEVNEKVRPLVDEAFGYGKWEMEFREVTTFSSAALSSDSDTLVTNVPIAIVSMGCLLPGADSPEEYWQNIQDGVSGIVDLGLIDPFLVPDFMSDGSVIAEKTYTLLSGRINQVEYEKGIPYSLEEFNKLTRGQQLLAKALAQCLNPIHQQVSATKTVHCLLGSTADGIKEYDEALFAESLKYFVEQLDEPEQLRAAFSNSLETLLGRKSGEHEFLAPDLCYKRVVEKFLGNHVKTLLLDAACASSLYTVDIGIKLLQNHESDLVLSGGVFAPGVAMNCLFAQFKGLSGTGSRPFDATADGVVFSEGAAILALKRLPDAIAAGDRIHGVIRGVGTSSDGKSAAVNVPTKVGQVLACQRACENAQINPNTIQYIEAHATATPVGDGTEFKSLSEVFNKREANLPPIYLGSVKALIGHTGWVAGTASIIKVCQALKAQTIPPQHNYQSPNKDIELQGSSLAIPTTALSWPNNIAGQPRRAAVNGFGFGGTNANLIIEAYDANYHQQFCPSSRPNTDSVRRPLALVGIGTLFPSLNALQGNSVPDVRVKEFAREELQLPVKRRLLPDVKDRMDASQYLSVMATEKALRGLGEKALALQSKTGVVIGMPGKTGRGITANERLFLDRLRRLLQSKPAHFSQSDIDFERLCQKLFTAIEQANLPSSPYTLIGSMPNITAGQVCNLFNFNGPNIVIDAGIDSLLEALRIAELMLMSNDCDLILAGSINGYVGHGAHTSGKDMPTGEAACMLALTTIEIAQSHGFPILSTLDVNTSGIQESIVEVAGSTIPIDFYGATGVVEIARSVERVSQSCEVVAVQWKSASQGQITFSPFPTPQQTSNEQYLGTQDINSQPLLQTPTHFYTSSLFPATVEKIDVPRPLEKRQILFLTDQPELWTALAQTQMLKDLNYIVACPANKAIAGAIQIDLTSEDAIKATVQQLDFSRYDTIVAIKNLNAISDEQLISIDDSDFLLNLLFAVVRHSYPQLQTGNTALATLCLNAWKTGQLTPYTGLLAGFIKSVARELPKCICKSINTDAASIKDAWQQLDTELNSQPGKPVEVSYLNGDRQIFKLVSLPEVTKDHTPILNQNSVVITTGGGRGVTAVLMEEVLQRFGCTVVLLGRTDLKSVPIEVLELDEAGFAQYESQFYQEQLMRDRSQKMPALKAQIEYYQAARELHHTLKHLSALPGRFEYVNVNITDVEAVNQVVAKVVKTYGRIDLVVHGAGIQTSKLLPKRTFTEFQRILATKLSGLKNLYNACRQYPPNNKVHFHLLTSAFSYIGNDGQPDYGAANEFMNRFAAYMDSSLLTGSWSTIAWLGWAGIGMTRGSEYAVLSQERGLHAIQAQEGQQLFSLLLNGQATAPINVLLTEGEKNYYQIDVVTAENNLSPTFNNGFAKVENKLTNETEKSILIPHQEHVVNSQKLTDERQWYVSIETAPYLLDHLVNNVPTMPATFEQELATQAAQALRPNLQLIAIENSKFSRFIKLFNEQEILLKTQAIIVVENNDETVIHVKLLSDFIHKNGTLLQKDCVHCEMDIRLAANTQPIVGRYGTWNGFEGEMIQEPYMHPNSPVRLKGIFDCINNIVIGSNRRRAKFRLKNTTQLHFTSDFCTPAILIDAMLRVATSSGDTNDSRAVFVPQGWKKITLTPDLNDWKLNQLHQDLFLVGSNSHKTGDTLYCDWLQVMDASDRVLVLMEEAIGLQKSTQLARL